MAASISLASTPELLAPVNSELWFRFTTSDFTLANFRYYASVYHFDVPSQANKTLLVREKVSARPITGDGVFSPHQILKSYLKNNFMHTLAFNKPYPLFSDGALCAYSVQVGYGYNPKWTYGNVSTNGITFGGAISSGAWSSGSVIKPASFPTPTSGTYYYVRLLLSSGHGLLVGDEVTLSKNNTGINPYYNGKSTVVTVGTTYVDLNILYCRNAYISGSTANDFTANTPNYIESGFVTDIISMRSESSVKYTWNGTKQYIDNTFNFTDRFQLKANPGYFPYIPGIYTPPYRNSWLTNYDFRNNWKPIYRTQDEVQEFFIKEINAITFAQFKTFDSAGALIATYNVPFTGVNLTQGALSDKLRRWGLEVGARSWEGHAYTSTLGGSGTVTFVGAAAYSVAIGARLAGGIEYWSEPVRYQFADANCVYENVRIAYLNRAGGYDYFNFSLNSARSISVTRTEYTKALAYNYAIGDRQASVLSLDPTETYTANTDFMSEHDYNVLTEIITSTDVYWIQGFGTTAVKIPILITDTTYKFKSRNTDKLFSMTINFKPSAKINVQSI